MICCWWLIWCSALTGAGSSPDSDSRRASPPTKLDKLRSLHNDDHQHNGYMTLMMTMLQSWSSSSSQWWRWPGSMGTAQSSWTGQSQMGTSRTDMHSVAAFIVLTIIIIIMTDMHIATFIALVVIIFIVIFIFLPFHIWSLSWTQWTVDNVHVKQFSRVENFPDWTQ